MATEFKDQAKLQLWLQRLGPLYSQYAGKLWDFGVRGSQELANASVETLRKSGISSDLHLDNIKASAVEGEFRLRPSG
jgi:hypothetical protein